MTDAVLSRTPGKVVDFTVGSDGDIEQADFFDTALLVSIFEEKRASASEVALPELRRGWIGNESLEGFERGSKIWLYEQARLNRDTINSIRSAAAVALQWLIDEGYAERIAVDVGLTVDSVSLIVVVTRPDSVTIRRELFLWNNSGVTSGI